MYFSFSGFGIFYGGYFFFIVFFFKNLSVKVNSFIGIFDDNIFEWKVNYI